MHKAENPMIKINKYFRSNEKNSAAKFNSVWSNK